jgi:uncharacterized protein YdhG (YjbR/CyaY superfamily)
VLGWVTKQFPGLGRRITWNQMMFTEQGTFIIAFSVAIAHLAAGPEAEVIRHFQAKYKRRPVMGRRSEVQWLSGCD